MKKRVSKKDTTSAPGTIKAAPLRIKASLELALLGLIAEQHPRSGYDLMQTFRASRFDGALLARASGTDVSDAGADGVRRIDRGP